MIAGLPGAGIGGLFYLASTLLLPARSLLRRLRGEPDAVTWRHQAHNLGVAAGIIGGLWMTGRLLGLVLPDELLARPCVEAGPHFGASRSAIPLATLAMAVGTLAFVLVAVEVAHHLHAATIKRRRAARAAR